MRHTAFSLAYCHGTRPTARDFHRCNSRISKWHAHTQTHLTIQKKDCKFGRKTRHRFIGFVLLASFYYCHYCCAYNMVGRSTAKRASAPLSLARGIQKGTGIQLRLRLPPGYYYTLRSIHMYHKCLSVRKSAGLEKTFPTRTHRCTIKYGVQLPHICIFLQIVDDQAPEWNKKSNVPTTNQIKKTIHRNVRRLECPVWRRKQRPARTNKRQ